MQERVNRRSGEGVSELEGAMRELGLMPVTKEELEAFDDSEFIAARESSGGEPFSAERLGQVLDRLSGPARVLPSPTGTPATGAGLFGEEAADPAEFRPGKYGFEVPRSRFLELLPVVTRAFGEVRDGWSPDFVIIHPDLNPRFVQRCWSLGAVASAEELNWTLMNARKAGKLAAEASAKRHTLPKKELDTFSFAAEMALRHIQDQAWAEEQRRDLSLDKLLCMPTLAHEFDQMAQALAPGRPAIDYRWAAMALRKARRLDTGETRLPDFERAGTLRDVKMATIPKVAGLYWVRTENMSSFVGVAEDLRLQIDHYRGSLGEWGRPSWLTEPRGERPELWVLPLQGVKIDERERLRSAKFRRDGSRLNFLERGQLSHSVAVA